MKLHRFSVFGRGLAFAALSLLLIIGAEGSRDGAAQGVQVCLRVLIPSLFPFMAVTQLMIRSGLCRQLGAKLQKPDKTNLKITIPEGKNAYQIAEILEKNGACTAKEFIAALSEKYDYDFLSSIDKREMRPYLLEGYLFPVTYEIEEGNSAKDIVNMMLSATGLRLDEAFRAACEKKNLSIDDVLTMASIIEKESGGTPIEMSKVSAVFWNRLNHPEAQNTPTLGSDPTVHYADMLEKQGYEKSIWQGYSTYTTQGLPTGPICSPSESAIQAALNPDEHAYYFFFTDKFEKFYYFETYEDFMQGRKEHGI